LIRLSAIATFGFLVGIAACDNEPEKTPEQKFMSTISGTWHASEITLDDLVIENAFNNFTLTIKEDKTFTSTNGNSPIWRSSGIFTPKATSSTELFDLTRDDGVEITVTEATSTSLVMQFHYVSGGRVSSVTGDYVFKLTR